MSNMMIERITMESKEMDVKHTIKYRSEVIEDIGVETIDYQIDNKPDVSFERDAWDGVELHEAVLSRAGVGMVDMTWRHVITPDDPDWEGKIVIYADK